MSRFPTIARLAGLALATGIGFAIGNSGEPISDTATAARGKIKMGDSRASENGEEGIAGGQSTSSFSARILSKRLRFAQHLATCDLSLFPEILLKDIETGGPTGRLGIILQTWVERDPEGHARWLETQPSTLLFGGRSSAGLDLQSTLLHVLAEEDPAKALAMAKRLKTAEHRQWKILEATLEKDPTKALELAQAHPDIYARPKLFFGSNGSGPDPMRALPVLRALHPGGGRSALANDGSNYYASHPEELEAAERWFQQLPPDAQRYVVNKIERGLFDQSFRDVVQQLGKIWILPGQSAP